MRKFYISLFAASLLATTTLAQGLTQKLHGSDLINGYGKVATAEDFQTLKSRGINPLLKLDSQLETKTAKAKAAENGDEAISETPEGTLIAHAYGESTGYRMLLGYVYNSSSSGNVVDMVDAGDYFYIKNPISSIISNLWLKGSKKKADKAGEADTILVELPQPIVNSGSSYIYAQNITIKTDETTGQKKYDVSEDQTLKFTWDGTTLTKLGTDVLGVTTSKGRWYGFGDDNITVYKFDEVPTTVPETAKAEYFTLKYNTDNDAANTTVKIVKAARDGNDLYIGDLISKQNLWAKATVDGDKLVFKRQYLGIDTTELYHMFYVPASVTFEYNENRKKYVPVVDEIDDLTYNYVAATGKYSAAESYVLAAGKDDLGTDIYVKPELTQWEDKAYSPSTPKITEIVSYGSKYNFGSIKFTLSAKSALGETIDENKLYYKFYLGDENTPYTFTPELNKRLTEDMTEVPYTFTDDLDFQILGETRTVFFNDPRFSGTPVGVQAIYKSAGEIKTSEIVWEQIPAGLNSTASDKASAVSVTFYDLSGRKVDNPASGLYIKSVELSDGTVKTGKVIK